MFNKNKKEKCNHDEWEVIRITHHKGYSSQYQQKDLWFSLFHSRCTKCGALDTELRRGFWRIEDFKKNEIQEVVDELKV